jgi:single-strand DNA-binding protein
MFSNTPITIVGNIGVDPEMRYTTGGNAVTSFNVAVPQRKYDKQTSKWEDIGTTWYRCTCWRQLAEHCAESLTRGSRVIVVGTLASRAWEDKEGNKRETWEITADAIGPDLTYATASVKRTARDTVPMPDDPWAGDGSAETGSEPAQAGNK